MKTGAASKVTNVAIYARVSTTGNGQNPEVQLAELRRFCEARGWRVAHELVDVGYSGSTADRPGLKQLEALVRQRKIDAVAVVALDRVFRNLRHLVTVLEEYQHLGVTFVAVRDQIDYSTAAGRFFAQVLGSLAEFERELIRERVQAGVDHARAKGKRLGRPRVHDHEKILALRAQGKSYREVARLLGAPEGVVSRVIAAARKSPRSPAP